MRRDTVLALLLPLLLLAMLPAYGRVFVDEAWRAPVLIAGVLAVLLAAVVRRLGGGGLVATAVSLVGLTAFTYTTALPDVGLLPDSSSLTALRELLAQVAIDLRESPAPAVAGPPFVVALTIGTWVVFHAAHEVLVRWRLPGAALVPPLVLWALPLAIPLTDDGAVRRALPFLAVAGLILLLATDDGGGADRAPRATASGLAVGTGALAIAVVAPLLLPGYGAAALVDLSGGGDPRGYQPIVDISERLQLPTERDVLRVRSSERSYLRLAGLDSFDGATWRLGPASGGSFRPDESDLYPADGQLPPEEPALQTTPVRTEIEVLDLANIYVPTPYQPELVLGPFRDEMVWSTEGGFLATWNLADTSGGARIGVTEGVEYAIDAARPTPEVDQLRDVRYDEATLERWTALPEDYDALADQAQQVFADAGADTTIDRALALQDWFTDDGGFTYDLDVDALRGSEALEAFVLEDRVGYCEYFATAMAVMLRASDIPARVAVGFLPGEVSLAADPEGGRPLTEYTVSTADAHAWVEVLFPGYGWVTFEPTPRSDQTQLVPTEDDLTPTESLRERNLRELAEAAEEIEDTDPAETPDVDPAVPEPTTPDATTGPDGAGDEDAPAVPAWWWVAAGVLGVGTVTAVARRRGDVVGDRDADVRVLAAQRRLLATARRYGVGRAPHESTAEAVDRWRAEGRTRTDGARFVRLTEAAAFGGEVDASVAEDAESLAASLEEELRASVPSRDRALAPVRVPAEVLVGHVEQARTKVGRAVRRDR